MKHTYNPNKIVVHGGWLRDKFFIWAEQKQHKRYKDYDNYQYPFLYCPFELKLAIFKDEPSSFYGTFIETEKAFLLTPMKERIFYSYVDTIQIYQARAHDETFLFPLEGIVIDMHELVKYLPTLKALEKNSTFQLADDIQFWFRTFEHIIRKMKAGEFLPTAHLTWELTNTIWENWVSAIPLSSLSIFDKRPQAFLTSDEQLQILTEQANQFCNAFIQHLIREDEAVRESFAALIENIQFNNITKVDEQDLLEKLEIVEATPFHTGLIISEGETANSPWSVTLFVQDKYDPSIIIFLSDLQSGNHPWRTNPISKVKIDLQRAKNDIPILQPLSLVHPKIEITKEDAYLLLTSYFHKLQNIGITLIAPSWWSNTPKQLKGIFTIKQNEQNAQLNWQEIASFNFQASIGDVAITEEQFTHLVKLKEPFVQINGNWIQWDVEEAIRLEKQWQERKQSMTYLDAWKTYLATEDTTHSLAVHFDNKLEENFQKIYQKQFPQILAPAQLNGTLRPYQLEGFSWLYNMRKVGFGACLADDMGLGKTIQTIAYMLTVLEKDKKEPFLLVCPTSLIANWENECQKFAPSLSIYIHHGQNRMNKESFEEKWEKVDLVITSYALVFRDEPFFTSFHWNGLILDEAQHVKNIDTKQRQAVKKITSEHKIALTGTPIENRLRELWSIIDLLNDRYLGSYQQFHQNFVKPIEERHDEERLRQLQQLIHPLILRRTKNDQNLQLQLPEKIEQIYRIGLSLEQATLYQAVVNQLFASIDEVRPMERKALILSSITKLKQICNHPAQFLKTDGTLHNRSEKWELLLTLVEQIVSRDEKVLIFTQYKEMATLIYHGLKEIFEQNIAYIDGSVNREKRAQQVNNFMTNDDTNIFILSLKAGGVGLNLTAASHVIHYDRWWNPAVENQATDRAYRIGQTKNVTVHKFITQGTLEERINDMLERKQSLSDRILLTSEESFTELSTEQLKELLQLTVPKRSE